MPDVVVVEGLRKAYGPRVALDGLALRVAEGEIFGILGPNGAGKTTTVECVEGLRRPDAGRIRVLGLDPTTDGTAVRRRIGAQLQDSALPDRMRVGEALALFASLAPGGPPWEPLLDQWGLTDHRRASFGTLSGGQRQRLFIALALVNAPEVVFLDELTTGLDPQARREAWDLIEQVRASGTTVVLVTHLMDEAERLCDRLVVVAGGRVVASGSPADLVERAIPGLRVRFTVEPATACEYLSAVPGVESVRRAGGQVTVTGTGPVLARVGHALVEHGVEPTDLRVERPTLEDAYLRLVGAR